MPKEDAKAIQGTEEFGRFFENASKLVMRGLNFESICRLDYGDKHSVARGEMLVESHFESQCLVKRPITTLEWSPNHSELYLVGYGEDPGLIHVCSTLLPGQTEAVLKCQSEVTAAKFHPNEPAIVIGGTYSGQLCKWDIRTPNHYPVQRSQALYQNQSFMIKGLHVQSTQNILAISNDGKMLDWGEEVKTVDLGENKDDKIGVQCISFRDGHQNFFIGGENSTIYSTRLHARDSNERFQAQYEGHFGSIMALDIHPRNFGAGQDPSKAGPIFSDGGNLILSCGVDWKLGLWNTNMSHPYMMTELEGEIYDMKWSPVHPSVFATSDGKGNIDLWDLSRRTDTYIYRKSEEKEEGINCIRWSNDGKKILTGNSSGVVKLWNVDKEFVNPREETMSELAKITDLAEQ